MEELNSKPLNKSKKSLIRQAGAGAVEYALVLAIIVTLVVGVSGVMKEPLQKFFKASVDKVEKFMEGGETPK